MKSFLTAEQEASLIDAIREQEARTSAEIRVCVTSKWIWRHQRYAWRKFDEIGMRDTARRNAALIVMMPRVRKVVVIGDRGLHAVVPPEYWQQTVDEMTRRMRETDPLDALREGLRRLGDVLSAHWPRQADDMNELSDDIVR